MECNLNRIELVGILLMTSVVNLKVRFNPGAGKRQPAGHIQPTRQFHLAYGALP